MPVELYRVTALSRPQRDRLNIFPHCCGFKPEVPLVPCGERQRHAPKHGGIFGFCARCVKVYPGKYTDTVPDEFNQLQTAFKDYISPPADESEQLSAAALAAIVDRRAGVQDAYLRYIDIPTFRCPGIYPNAPATFPGYQVTTFTFNGTVIRMPHAPCTSPTIFRCGHVSDAPVCNDPDHRTQWETGFQPASTVEGIPIHDTTCHKAAFRNVIGSSTSSKADVITARANVSATFVEYWARQEYLNQLEESRDPQPPPPAIATLTVGDIPPPYVSCAQKRSRQLAQRSTELTERTKQRRAAEEAAAVAAGGGDDDADGATSHQPQQLGSPGASGSQQPQTQQGSRMPPIPEDETDTNVQQLGSPGASGSQQPQTQTQQLGSPGASGSQQPQTQTQQLGSPGASGSHQPQTQTQQLGSPGASGSHQPQTQQGPQMPTIPEDAAANVQQLDVPGNTPPAKKRRKNQNLRRSPRQKIDSPPPDSPLF